MLNLQQQNNIPTSNQNLQENMDFGTPIRQTENSFEEIPMMSQRLKKLTNNDNDNDNNDYNEIFNDNQIPPPVFGTPIEDEFIRPRPIFNNSPLR